MIQLVTSWMISHLSWIGVDFVDPSSEFEEPSQTSKQVRFFDYACGPGTLTAIFLPYITEAVGLDLSENMVDAYNKRFLDSNKNVKATIGNLVDPTNPPPPEWSQDPSLQSFDFVAIGFGVHHFEDPPGSIKALAERVRPGGVFLLAEILDERTPIHHGHDTPSFREIHSKAYGITKPHGFTRQQMEDYFTAAGLVDFKMEVIGEKVIMDMKNKEGNLVQIERELFIAVGKRPDGAAF